MMPAMSEYPEYPQYAEEDDGRPKPPVDEHGQTLRPSSAKTVPAAPNPGHASSSVDRGSGHDGPDTFAPRGASPLHGGTGASADDSFAPETVPLGCGSGAAAAQRPASSAAIATAVLPQRPGPVAPGDAASRAPKKPSRVGHFLKWVIAAIGVFFGLLGIEVLAAVLVLVAMQMLASYLEPLAAGSSPDMFDPTTEKGFSVATLAIEIVTLAAVIPWWFHVDKRGIGRSRRKEEEGRFHVVAVALRVLAIAMLAFGVQVVLSVAVGTILTYFPEVMNEYEELMESAGLTEFTLTSALAAVVVGPAMEELFFRGIALQFALRAVCRDWRSDLRKWEYGKIEVSTAQFWVANVIQALVFAVAHLNITQASYAFLAGLLLGWVFWRTGKLRYDIALHMSFNLASFAIDPLFASASDPVAMAIVVLSAVLVVLGIWLYQRATKGSALPGKKGSRAEEKVEAGAAEQFRTRDMGLGH